MQGIRELKDVVNGPWNALAEALRKGLPVPYGFVADPQAREQDIRAAYDELKHITTSHFVALRSSLHALLDVLGNDNVIYSLRRLWAETPEDPILIQRMVNADWCGKVLWDEKNLRIKANAGLLLLDPDTYLIHRNTGKCARRTLQKTQRKMFRWIDGSSKTVENEGERIPLTEDQLQAIVRLAESAAGDITWALEDSRIWLLAIRPRSLPS